MIAMLRSARELHLWSASEFGKTSISRCDMSDAFVDAYQWNFRSRDLVRPAWFTSWPNGARIAVVIIVLHEWESVPYHRSRPMPANSHHKFDFLALGGREYGVKHGLWRLLDVLDGHQVKSTVVASGLMAKLFPAGLAAAHRRGHEIAAHQWDQCVFPTSYRTREEERSALVKTIEAMQTAVGERVRGYMSPGPRPTAHTLDIIAELDFRWTCDYLDSDIPSVINISGKRIASVGYSTPGCVDSQLMQHGTPADVLAEMKYTFDALYDEAARAPTKFCYAVHTHWGGMPGMARMLDEFLRYVRNREGVGFMRCSDIADMWLSRQSE